MFWNNLLAARNKHCPLLKVLLVIEDLLEMRATQVFSGHKEEILEQHNQLVLMKVLGKPRSCKKQRMCVPVTSIRIGFLLEYSEKE